MKNKIENKEIILLEGKRIAKSMLDLINKNVEPYEAGLSISIAKTAIEILKVCFDEECKEQALLFLVGYENEKN